MLYSNDHPLRSINSSTVRCEIIICLLGAKLSIVCAYIRLSRKLECVGATLSPIFKEIHVTILILVCEQSLSV